MGVGLQPRDQGGLAPSAGEAMSMIQEIKTRALTMNPVEVSSDELRAVDTELKALITRISTLSSYDDAVDDLRELGEFQETLALVWFQHDVEILPDQKTLVRKFDRSDDPDTCKYTFEEIRNGRFLIT